VRLSRSAVVPVSTDRPDVFESAAEYHHRHRAGMRVASAEGFVWEVSGRCAACGYTGPVLDLIIGIPPKRRLCADCAVSWVFGDE
jgi:hypothetical protein